MARRQRHERQWHAVINATCSSSSRVSWRAREVRHAVRSECAVGKRPRSGAAMVRARGIRECGISRGRREMQPHSGRARRTVQYMRQTAVRQQRYGEAGIVYATRGGHNVGGEYTRFARREVRRRENGPEGGRQRWGRRKVERYGARENEGRQYSRGAGIENR